MAKKWTPEELKEENDRVTPIGLFLSAEAYWRSAGILVRASKRRKPRVSFPFDDSPIRFCYYHAIELYLKAFLRHSHGVDELEGKYRHSATKLMNRAKELGIVFDDEDVVVLTMMGDTDAVIRARYTRRGLFTWPTLEALERACRSLRWLVNDGLKKGGETLPLIRRVGRGEGRQKKRRRAVRNKDDDFPDGFVVG